MLLQISRRALLLGTTLSAVLLSAASEHKEVYKNLEYGFEVELPQDWKVIVPEPPTPQHGIALVQDQRRIWIDGSYDALMFGSAPVALKEILADEVPDVHAETGAAKLDNLPAAAAQFRHGDKVYSRIIGYRPRADEVGIIYNLGLATDEKNEAQDRETFLGIASRFKLLSLARSDLK